MVLMEIKYAWNFTSRRMKGYFNLLTTKHKTSVSYNKKKRFIDLTLLSI